MQLNDHQLQQFHAHGLLLLPQLFSPAEVALLRADLTHLYHESNAANIIEKHSGQVRTAMALHQRSTVFEKLVRHPRLVKPAQQILGTELYIQQAKVNVKGAFDGESWHWHYDFATHQHDDGVPQALALNLHVFLDDVNEFNGPLHFIPGSHQHGPAPSWHDTVSTSYPLWLVEHDTVARLVDQGGLMAAKGLAGTGLIFGDLMVHSSPPNLSPWDRCIFSLILNPISNAQTTFARPDYKHHRDFTAVTALDDDCLRSAAVV